jgi:hypothetical protein
MLKHWNSFNNATWNCKICHWTSKAIFLHTGRSPVVWILLCNFALMRLENLHHFSDLHDNFWFNAIWHRQSMGMSICCRRVAESVITVMQTVMCMDWLHWWYNHAAHLVSSSTALAFPTNMTEIHKCTSPREIQMHDQKKTLSTEKKLDTISRC